MVTILRRQSKGVGSAGGAIGPASFGAAGFPRSQDGSPARNGVHHRSAVMVLGEWELNAFVRLGERNSTNKVSEPATEVL